MEKDNSTRVVVITGASSGIGRATALSFAKKGDTVIGIARRKKKLEKLASEIQNMGAACLVFPADVTDKEAVSHIVEETIKQFGRIDVWVNNAAVNALGKFEKIPEDVFRRVMDVNFFGYVNCTREVLPQFQKQKKGVLINVSSIVGKIPQPYSTAYVSSKFAVRGFSEALRLELAGTGIEVCIVIPASIDTPHFQHAANYSGKEISALKPVYPAQDVADTILDLADNPKREAIVGTSAKVISLTHNLMEGGSEKMFAEQVKRDHFSNTDAEDSTGILFEPIDDNMTISGGWDKRA